MKQKFRDTQLGKSKYDDILKQEERDVEELQEFIDSRNETD